MALRYCFIFLEEKGVEDQDKQNDEEDEELSGDTSALLSKPPKGRSDYDSTSWKVFKKTNKHIFWYFWFYLSRYLSYIIDTMHCRQQTRKLFKIVSRLDTVKRKTSNWDRFNSHFLPD